MEEHAEALRREALAQELAEAEAGEGVDELLQGEGIDEEDPDGTGGRDLDDEVPDADEDEVGDGESDTSEDSDDSNTGDENEIEEIPRNNILTSRGPDAVFRSAHARELEFGASGLEEDEEEDPSQILQEEDLVHESHLDENEMDMDADLDADIPDADEEGGYEHTDTEAELSSSDEDGDSDIGVLQQRRGPLASSMVRSDGTQNSLDLSGMGSSPQMGFSRRG